MYITCRTDSTHDTVNPLIFVLYCTWL